VGLAAALRAIFSFGLGAAAGDVALGRTPLTPGTPNAETEIDRWHLALVARARRLKVASTRCLLCPGKQQLPHFFN
jgi:hypothetical protein